MSVEDRHIMGSAEPLSPEQTEARLRELEAWGVDLSLVWASLQQSPTERLNHMLGMLAFTQEMQRAWKEQRARAAPEMRRVAEDAGTSA
jgi:hypothetical protein